MIVSQEAAVSRAIVMDRPSPDTGCLVRLGMPLQIRPAGLPQGPTIRRRNRDAAGRGALASRVGACGECRAVGTWEPLPGMVKRQCLRCRYWFAASSGQRGLGMTEEHPTYAQSPR